MEKSARSSGIWEVGFCGAFMSVRGLKHGTFPKPPIPALAVAPRAGFSSAKVGLELVGENLEICW
jgi:hypothetical protein